VNIKAYSLSMSGLTHRQIADVIGCKPEQVKGKVQAGRYAVVRDERGKA
jgi:hypothetical protein